MAQVKVDPEPDHLSFGHGERGLNVNGGLRAAERDSYSLDGRVLGRIIDDQLGRLKGYGRLVVRPFRNAGDVEDGRKLSQRRKIHFDKCARAGENGGPA